MKVPFCTLTWPNLADPLSCYYSTWQNRIGFLYLVIQKCCVMLYVISMSWPENQGFFFFFLYFSNIANEPDIFHGFPP